MTFHLWIKTSIEMIHPKATGKYPLILTIISHAILPFCNHRFSSNYFIVADSFCISKHSLSWLRVSWPFTETGASLQYPNDSAIRNYPVCMIRTCNFHIHLHSNQQPVATSSNGSSPSGFWTKYGMYFWSRRYIAHVSPYSPFLISLSS